MSRDADLTRRRFLGLAGITSLAAGLTCATGAAGYFLLSAVRRSHGAADPSPTPRPLSLKQIERPVITSRTDWGAREPNHEARNESGFYSLLNEEGWREYEGDLRATYTTVVVHHSVILETADDATMREIQDLHMDDRGWADIAYHFGVGTTGAVFEGRALDVRGTHVEGANTGSVGVVFFGNFEETVPTAEQLGAGEDLINWLALRLELTHLAGHMDFNDFTDCPGRNLSYYLEALAQSAGLELGTGGYVEPET
ncbi:N-acetylmuramoyl-L-alanine amidase [Aggregatilinea lenta]|uniref:N-acetylmuramoyl-L-alanine amidase n=1 Tax=Aggregatilinea lenta TaxID=913108 RepID=UPI000E5B6D1A|nr:N-acetylmuramoyl-L-alanine amidase [Aggregatilinea lenta]